jgi:hypothetical protein
MAEVKLQIPFDEIHGAIEKKALSTVRRSTATRHPDPQAPIDPHTGKPKRYLQLPAFIRAMLYQTLKTEQSPHS